MIMREHDKSFQHVMATNTPITHKTQRFVAYQLQVPPQNYNFVATREEKGSSNEPNMNLSSGT